MYVAIVALQVNIEDFLVAIEMSRAHEQRWSACRHATRVIKITSQPQQPYYSGRLRRFPTDRFTHLQLPCRFDSICFSELSSDTDKVWKIATLNKDSRRIEPICRRIWDVNRGRTSFQMSTATFNLMDPISSNALNESQWHHYFTGHNNLFLFLNSNISIKSTPRKPWNWWGRDIAPLQKHRVAYNPSSKLYRHLSHCYFEGYSTYLRIEILLISSISKNTHIIPESPWIGNSATEAVPLISCDWKTFVTMNYSLMVSKHESFL
jgi:hypothetical protein